MGNRLFVGNLSYNTSEEELRQTFEQCGSVTHTKIIKDRETGNSRGFGFVEFQTDLEATAAITTLNGILLAGRSLAVKEAEERKPRTDGFGGSGGGGNRVGYQPQAAQLPPPPKEDSGRRNRGRDGGKRRRDNDSNWD